MSKSTVIRENVKYTSPYETYNVDVHLSHYSNNGRKAILLVDHETSEPIATATVNVPDKHIAEDEVIIKNYSENEGMLHFLINQQIIDGSKCIPFNNGYVMLYVCPLLLASN